MHICPQHSECNTPEFIEKVSVEKKIFDAITTFDELCNYGVKYVNNIYKYFPTWYACDDRINCYETNDNIVYYLSEFNSNGYYTNLSQPADNCACNVTNCHYLQRAFVRGYVKPDIGNKIFEKLKNDPRIYIELHSTTRIIDLTDKNVIIGVNGHSILDILMQYVNDNTQFYEFDIKSNILTDDAGVVTLVDGVGRTFSSFMDILKNEDCRNKNNKIFTVRDKYFDELQQKIKDPICHLVICDKEWGNNDEYMWKMILSILKNN